MKWASNAGDWGLIKRWPTAATPYKWRRGFKTVSCNRKWHLPVDCRTPKIATVVISRLSASSFHSRAGMSTVEKLRLSRHCRRLSVAKSPTKQTPVVVWKVSGVPEVACVEWDGPSVADSLNTIPKTNKQTNPQTNKKTHKQTNKNKQTNTNIYSQRGTDECYILPLKGTERFTSKNLSITF